MWDWYRSAIIETGRQPVLFAFIAFVLTLLTTRIIVRLIRAGKGPFGNVSAGGLHVHHVVPGIILMGIGGLIGLASSAQGPLPLLAGLLFGAGAALVLDEFPLILHLEDVYWEQEGRLSVEVTTLAIVVLGTAVLVAQPNVSLIPPSEATPALQFVEAMVFTVFWIIPVAITLLKGKVFTAAVSLPIPIFAYVGMIRLAKPTSPWAIRRYDGKKMAIATARHQRHEERIAPWKDAWSRSIFGFGDSPAKSDDPKATAAPAAEAKPPSEVTRE